jgi:hypothetical protein
MVNAAELPGNITSYIDEEAWNALYDTGATSTEEFTYQSLSLEPDALREQREKFLASGGERQPDFRPWHVDVAEVNGRSDRLLEMIADVPRYLPRDPQLQDAYYARIGEEYANLMLVGAAVTGRTATYKAANEVIYGRPDKQVFAAVAGWYCNKAEAVLLHKRPEVQAAAQGVLNALHEHRGDPSILTPDRETFMEVRKRQLETAVGFTAVLLNGIELPSDAEVTALTGDQAARRMFDNIGSEKDIKPAEYWSMSTSNNALMRPDDYHMPQIEFLEFMVHEMAHDDERINALHGPIKLATSGLDRYEIGNEGRAVTHEQTVNEHIEDFTARGRWNELLGRHLTSSLASGYAGDPAAVEVYKVIRDISRLYEYTRPEISDDADLSEATERADRAAWELLYGSYKGTDGSGQQKGYNRPTIYLEGSINSWRNADRIPMGRSGKFDISNQRHVDVMEAYGALRVA